MPLAKSEVDQAYDAKLGVALRFKVTITADGAPAANLKYWTQVSGIEQKIKVISFNASDGIDYTNQLPGLPEPGKIKLTRAVTEQDTQATFKWIHTFQHAHKPKGTMTVHGYTAWGDPAGKWTFTGIWPCSWTGPAYNTTDAKVATEVLEIVHDGMLQAVEAGHAQG